LAGMGSQALKQLTRQLTMILPRRFHQGNGTGERPPVTGEQLISQKVNIYLHPTARTGAGSTGTGFHSSLLQLYSNSMMVWSTIRLSPA
jgi:hypothetical protein